MKSDIYRPNCYGQQPSSSSETFVEQGCKFCFYVRGCGDSKSQKVMGEQARVGDKHDKGKPRWSLLPLGIIKQVIEVLEFGANRYQVDNWQHVPDARRRYYDAMMRHVDAWWNGEQNDPESGRHHLAHAIACAMFLMWLEGKRDEVS